MTSNNSVQSAEYMTPPKNLFKVVNTAYSHTFFRPVPVCVHLALPTERR